MARQREPLVWYPADALGTNMLDPDASQMDPSWWTNVLPGWRACSPAHPGLPGAAFLVVGVHELIRDVGALVSIPVPHNTTLTASVYLSAYDVADRYFWLERVGH